MKLLLPFAVALMAVGLVGMTLRGPAVAGVTVEAEPDATGSMSIRLDRHEPDWLPTPDRGRVLEAGETVQVIPLDVWRASLVIAEPYQYPLLRACWCESRWQTGARGAAGERGACQVIPRFHGPVPSDLAGQFAQASRIAEQHGLAPWTTRHGCAGWNAE